MNLKAAGVKPKARVATIEWFRFLAALVVMNHHFLEFFTEEGGKIQFAYVVVEFFFLLSGFLMMKYVDTNEKPMPLGSFLLHKVSSFYPVFMVAFAMQFVLFVVKNQLGNAVEVGGALFHFKWEALMLQTAGFIQDPQFNIDYLLGQAWYLSAMLLALLVVYPLACYCKKVFLSIICPTLVVLVYGYIIETQATLNIGSEFLGFVSSAVVRALAATCLGCLAYAVTSYFKKAGFAKPKLAAVLEVVTYMCVAIFVVIGNGRSMFISNEDSLFFVLVFACIIVFAFVGKTPISVFLNTHATRQSVYLGSISLYLYLLHWPILNALQLFFAELPFAATIVLYYILCFGTSVLLCYLYKKRKNMWPFVCFVVAVLLFSFTLPYWAY